VLLLVALALAVLASALDGEAPARLVATVGPGFTIDLADANGNHVDSVVAGRYEVLVHDLSDMHNFVLGNKATGARPVTTEVEFVGDQTFTVDLTPGAYGYACSPHFQTMNGSLTVVSPRLAASVGAGAVFLSATRLPPGSYSLAVTDRSRSRNFHLVGPGVDRRTGKRFTGRVTWQLPLAAGTYRFGSDPKLRGRLTVG
jgi:plastocyanin